MLDKGIDWEAVKFEYMNGTTLKELAQRFEVHFTTIQKKAKKENWPRSKQASSRVPRVIEKDYQIDNIVPEALLGIRCPINKDTIISLILKGWTNARAFGACGFNKQAAADWLENDPEFLRLTLASRNATLGRAEESIFLGATRRGSTEAAMKILQNAPESADDYRNVNSGGPKIQVNVQIGSVPWDRDKKPIEVEYKEITDE
jgi:hypothetical protein